MKYLTGINIVVLGLTLVLAAPVAVGAYAKLITPTTLEQGYATQQTLMKGQIKTLQDAYTKCGVSTSTQCTSIPEQISSINKDLHILDVSYQLMNSSLQAPVPIYQ